MNPKRLFDDDDALFGEPPNDDRPSHVEIRRDGQGSANESGSDEPPATNPEFAVAQNHLLRIPTLAVGPRELALMPLDHREGFLVSLIDGVTSIETILDVCAMPADEALEILESLFVRGVITIPR